jgi:YHS domain-containing protein
VTPRGGSATYGEQTIAFCCPGCDSKFEADPERFMRTMRADPLAYAYDRPGPTGAQLRLARKTAGSVNGLCPVMKRLVTARGGSAEYRGMRVAFCCPGCVAKFQKDPAGWFAMMQAEPAVYGLLPATR